MGVLHETPGIVKLLLPPQHSWGVSCFCLVVAVESRGRDQRGQPINELQGREAKLAAIIALSLYTSTYVAEIVRAAIKAVPHGQTEAALSVGMRAVQCLWHALLPQAVKLMSSSPNELSVSLLVNGTVHK